MVRLKNHMLSKRFPVKIHVWGGLGSQLFGLALAFDLNKRLSNRKLVLIYHTSGVTKRAWDLPLDLVDITVVVKDDFELLDTMGKPHLFLKKLHLDEILKFFYSLSGFHSDCNTTKKSQRIKPWVRNIRGHYSHRLISNDTSALILNTLQKHYYSEFKGSEYSPNSAIQYRLGDLLKLKDKSFISEKAIINLIEQNIILWPRKIFDLYSDSLEAALNLLSTLSIIPHDYSPHKTVLRCLDYKYFIGTNSKLTIWIVLFRLSKDSDSYNFVPNVLKSELSQCVGDMRKFNNLIYYG